MNVDNKRKHLVTLEFDSDCHSEEKKNKSFALFPGNFDIATKL